MAVDQDLQAVYDVAAKNGWMKNDSDFQQLGHIFRANNWVKADPTQGGVLPPPEEVMPGVAPGTPLLHPMGVPGEDLATSQQRLAQQQQIQSIGKPFVTIDPTGYSVLHGGNAGADRYFNEKGHPVNKSQYLKAVTGASPNINQAQSYDSNGQPISSAAAAKQQGAYTAAHSNPLNHEFWQDTKDRASADVGGLSQAAGKIAGHIDLGHYQKGPDRFTTWLQTHDKWAPEGVQKFAEAANQTLHHPAETAARSVTGAVAGLIPFGLGAADAGASAAKVLYHAGAGAIDAARGNVQGEIEHAAGLNKARDLGQQQIYDLAGGDAGAIAKLSRSVYYAAHPNDKFAGDLTGKDMALHTVQNVINSAGEQLWKDPAQFALNAMMVYHGATGIAKPVAEMSYSRAAQHWRNVQIDAVKAGDAQKAALAGARASTYEGTVTSMRSARGADKPASKNPVARTLSAVNNAPNALLDRSYRQMLQQRQAGLDHFAQIAPRTPAELAPAPDNDFNTSNLGGPAPLPDSSAASVAMTPEMRMLLRDRMQPNPDTQPYVGANDADIHNQVNDLMAQVMRMTPEQMNDFSRGLPQPAEPAAHGNLGAVDVPQIDPSPVDAMRANLNARPSEPAAPEQAGNLGGPVGEPRPLPEPAASMTRQNEAPGAQQGAPTDPLTALAEQHASELSAIHPDVAQQHPAVVENLVAHHAAQVAEAQRPTEAVSSEKSQGGKPQVADRNLQKQANEYNKQNGLPRMKLDRAWEPVDPRAKDIADAYDAMQHKPNAAAVRKSYGALKREIVKQWNFATKKMGIKFEPWTKDGQPYANSDEMMADVRDNKHLYFFRGGDMPGDHPLSLMNKDTGLTHNDMLRAVHDLYGHAVNGYSFGPRGEENAWIKHAQMFSQEARGALTTETKGQNSWVNFGAHLRDEHGNIPKQGQKGHVPPPDRPFAEQKAGLLPDQYHSRPKEATDAQRTQLSGRGERGTSAEPSDVKAGAREPVSEGDRTTEPKGSDQAASAAKTDTGSGADRSSETDSSAARSVRDVLTDIIKDETGSGHDAVAYLEALTRGVKAAKGSPAGIALARMTEDAVHWLSPRTWVPKSGLDTLGEMRGEQEHKIWRVEQLFHESRKMFDKMSNADLIKFIDNQKSGSAHDTPELQWIGDTYRALEDDLHKQLQARNPDAAYLENHFRVFWKKIPGADTEKSGLNGLGRRPLQGSKGFLKQHTLDTIAEGIAAGGEPVTYNPQRLFELNYADTLKYITAQKMMEGLKANGLAQFVRVGAEPPADFSRLDDRIAQVYYRHMIQQLHATPETIYQMSDKLRGPLDEEQQGKAALSLERRDVPGPVVKAGEIFVEHNTARVLNNYLSRDLIRESELGKGVLWLKNATTALELSFSAFHAIAESLEAGGSEFGLGAKMLADKKPGLGVTSMAKGIVPFLSAYETARIGGSVIQYARNADEFVKTNRGQSFIKQFPDAARLIQDLFAGGAKLSMHQDYKLNSIQAFSEAWKGAKDGKIAGFTSAVWHAAPALIEYTMKPLFEYYIPRLKVGMFLKEYSYQAAHEAHRLGEAPNPATGNVEKPVVTRTTMAREAWDRVENRLGEMNFDNLYWDRTFKSALQLVFRSVTWKLGNVRALSDALTSQGREVAAAVRDRRAPTMTHGMGWLLGMTVTTAVISSVVQAIATGLAPGEDKDHKFQPGDVLKDLIFPKTDSSDPKARIATPTMWKDFANLQHDPAEYLKSAQSSDIGALREAYENRDFFHTQVYNPDDPAHVKAWDVFRHVFKLPISFQSFAKSHSEGEPAWKQATAFGIATKVPAWVTRDPLEEYLFQAGLSDPKPTLTREQADANQLVYKDEKLYNTGQLTKDDLKGKIKAGELNVDQVIKILSSHGKGGISAGFGKLSLEGAIKAWKLANEDEQKALKGQFQEKVGNNADKMTPKQHQQLKALGIVLR